MEAVAATNTITAILKAIATFIALFTPVEPLADGALTLELMAAGEFLTFADPVQFEVVPGDYGDPEIVATLSDRGAMQLEAFTGRHIGEDVDFIVCGQTLMSPRVMGAISEGSFVISGPAQASAMVDILENGCP